MFPKPVGVVVVISGVLLSLYAIKKLPIRRLINVLQFILIEAIVFSFIPGFKESGASFSIIQYITKGNIILGISLVLLSLSLFSLTIEYKWSKLIAHSSYLLAFIILWVGILQEKSSTYTYKD